MADSTDDQPLPHALVVDDEKEVADAYALRLRECCSVETAYGGREALSHLQEQEVDVVLLDRHMPGLSGDEVLATLDDRGFDGRVIMVTAIDPAFDVLEMPFDDYLCKPIERDGLRSAVDQQCRILGYATLGRYFEVESKRSILDAELRSETLADHPEYRELERRADTLSVRARRLLPEADDLFERFDAVGREGR